jgi:hypothetical protein
MVVFIVMVRIIGRFLLAVSVIGSQSSFNPAGSRRVERRRREVTVAYPPTERDPCRFSDGRWMAGDLVFSETDVQNLVKRINSNNGKYRKISQCFFSIFLWWIFLERSVFEGFFYFLDECPQRLEFHLEFRNRIRAK